MATMKSSINRRSSFAVPLAIVFVAILASVSRAETVNPELSKYLLRAPSGSAAKKSSNSVKTSKKKAATVKSDPEAPLVQRAGQELYLAPEFETKEVIETPATVLATVEPVRVEPIKRDLEMAVGVQLYRPEGLVRVTGFEPYRLSEFGERVMPVVEVRSLGHSSALWPQARIGSFASVGYAYHPLNLRGPTGFTYADVRLHTIKSELGAAAEWRAFGGDRPWSLSGQAGLGRLDSIQASDSPDSSQSAALYFASIGAGVERDLVSRLAVFGSYAFRYPVQKSSVDLDLPRHNLLIGFRGSLP